MQAPLDDPLMRIQREISEVVEREHELRNGHITPPKQNNDVNMPPERTLQRALSSSTITFNAGPPNPKRFAPNPDQRGLMQRFLKSRGKLSLTTIAPVRDQPAAIAWDLDTLAPSKVQTPTGKLIRKGYVPVEERIQQELREMQNREAELKAHQRKTLAASQPDLLAILDASDSPPDSPPPTPGKLRLARSMAMLCDSDELPDDTASAPSSLRPAVSLAQLCDDLDDTDVPSSSSLIAKFESIIQNNLANGTANHL